MCEYFERVGIDKFVVPLQDTLFSYLDLKKRSGRLTSMPSEFSVRRAGVDIDVRTSKLPVTVATHHVGWSNNGINKPHIPTRIEVPNAQIQKNQPPLDLVHLCNQQMMKPCDYQQETGAHLQAMCKLRRLPSSGKKSILVARLIEYDAKLELATKNAAETVVVQACGVPSVDRAQMQEYVTLKQTLLKRSSQDAILNLCASKGLRLAKTTSKNVMSRALIKCLTKNFTIIPTEFCDLQADKVLITEAAQKSKK